MGRFSWPRFIRRSSMLKWFQNAALLGVGVALSVLFWQGVYALIENKYLPPIGGLKAPKPIDIHMSVLLYLCLLILAVPVIVGVCAGIYIVITESIDQARQGVPLTEWFCFNVVAAIVSVVGVCVGVLAVAWVCGHFFVAYNIMSVQKDVKNSEANFIKCAIGLGILMVVVVVVALVGFLLYWIYSTFLQSYQATVEELDVERQQITAKAS